MPPNGIRPVTSGKKASPTVRTSATGTVAGRIDRVLDAPESLPSREPRDSAVTDESAGDDSTRGIRILSSMIDNSVVSDDAIGLDGLPVDPALVAEAAALDEAAAAARHAELAAEIQAANTAYYEADAPTLTDAEWDQRF